MDGLQKLRQEARRDFLAESRKHGATNLLQGIPYIGAIRAALLIALIQTQCDVSRLTAGPPDIPPDRLAALRTAFRMAMKDKELLAKTEKLGLPIEPAYGDTVLQMVKEALKQSPETVALLAESLKKK